MEQIIPYETLHRFTQNIFIAIGHTIADAKLGADVLLSADLRGIDSHGVARLSGYVRLWEAKRMNPKPVVTIEHETPSTATVDGDNGLGLIVAPKAMQIAIDKACNVGTGWVAVNHSNHFGIAGYHAMLALEHDMIGIALTNASPTTAPTFSKERLLGTNPIAVAIPASKQPPFVADFATTATAFGKIEILQRKNLDVPLGWIQDKDGHPVTDALGVKKGGAMLPLGSDRIHGSQKGYCLGAVVDILSAVLSGANYGPWVPPFLAFIPLAQQQVGKGLGHFVGAMRIDAFRPAAEFKSHMDHWIEAFRNAKPTAEHERVLIPGDPEREATKQRMQHGVPLLQPVVDDLVGLGEKFGLKL